MLRIRADQTGCGLKPALQWRVGRRKPTNWQNRCPVTDLQAPAVQALGIDQMDVGDQALHLGHKVPHRPLVFVAGQLLVRNIQAKPEVVLLPEIPNLVGVHEHVVEALPAEVPWIRRHGLRDDFNAVAVEGGQAGFQPPQKVGTLGGRQEAVGRKSADIGHNHRPRSP